MKAANDSSLSLPGSNHRYFPSLAALEQLRTQLEQQLALERDACMAEGEARLDLTSKLQVARGYCVGGIAWGVLRGWIPGGGGDTRPAHYVPPTALCII